MICRCPACGRTTRVATDLVGFLTRCERCRCLLLTRAIPPADDEVADGPDTPRLTLHVVATGRVAETPAIAGPLAELLSRPKPRKNGPPELTPSTDNELWQAGTTLTDQASGASLDTLEALALRRRQREWRLAANRPNLQHRRRNLRAIAVLTLATAGAILLYALAIGLEKTLLRPESARGENPPAAPWTSTEPPPPAPAANQAPSRHVKSALPTPTPLLAPQRPASSSVEGPSGELFPQLPPQP